MEINKIDDLSANSQVERLRSPENNKKCTFDKKVGCGAPEKLLYDMCATCYRIDSRFIVPNLFKKIIDMGAQLFNLRGPESGQPPAET